MHSPFFKKFIGTDEYIQIIFIGSETNEYKGLFVGLGHETTNMWAVRFDFDRPHIFVGSTTSPTNIRSIYLSVMWCHR
jgi:hypothetical protein